MSITNYFNVRPPLGDITNDSQPNRHKRSNLVESKNDKFGNSFSPKRLKVERNSLNQPKICEIFQTTPGRQPPSRPPQIANDLLRSFLGDDITVEEFYYHCSRHDYPSLKSTTVSYEVAEYIHQIIAYEKIRELRDEFKITDFLSTNQHPKLDADMLAILADWIVEVQENFMLNHETLHLIWSIFLAYLQNSASICGREIQLLACAAIMVACKHEEHQMPQLEELQYITNYCYGKNDFLEAEKKLLTTINFAVHRPNAYIFLRRFARVLDVNDQHIQYMTRFLLECGMHSFPLSISRSSKKAAAVLWLTRIVLNNPSYKAWLKTKEIIDLRNEIISNPAAKEYYCSQRKNRDRTLVRTNSTASNCSFLRENSINSSQSILSLSTDESMCSPQPQPQGEVLDPVLKEKIDNFRLDCGQKRPIWPSILTYITGFSEQEIIPMALLYHRVAMLLIAEVAKVSSEDSQSGDSRCNESSNQSSTCTQSNSSSVENQLKKSVVSKYCSKSFLCVANLYPQMSYENLVPKFASLQCPDSCSCFVCSHLISSSSNSSSHKKS